MKKKRSLDFSLHGLIRALVALPRRTKQLVMLLTDIVALPACTLIAAWLVTPPGGVWPSWLLVISAVLSVAALNVFGFYRSIVRFMGLDLVVAAFKSMTLTSLGLFVCIGLLDSWPLALRAGAAFWLLAMVYVAGSRMMVRLLLRNGRRTDDRVVIYGAGEAGVNLANAIAARGEFKLMGFIDDNPALQGAVINGLEVHAPSALEGLIEELDISRVLLALPSIRRRQRQAIIKLLERLPVHVQTMPDIHDLISGNARVDEIREVDIADLLGRESVPPIPELLGACIVGKCVMVTGAGGSIGSELCMQIALLCPKRLILLETSEIALYRVDKALRDTVRRKSLNVEIVPMIGSAHHKKRVYEVMSTYSVDTVYHAAAYKHVPLVEHNMIEGVHNNVFGTLHTAQAAIDANVESFVLVSTDKAVKPTNVMGATKRFAELVLQGLHHRGTETKFSMVRFGNVLASSGSVVPLFREQIRNGGPVTVTHREIYRYFMTIPEAASLVLQAGSMTEGGDVFVLDMGEAVRIADLAERMIHLMGLTVRDEENPDGDIEIKYTGLRPAEKLYEELMIGDNVMGTEHRRIMRAEEEWLPWDVLQPMLERLWEACHAFDCDAARQILLQGVIEYQPTDQIEDLLWRKRNGGRGAVVIPPRGATVTPLESRRTTPAGDRTH